MRGITSTRVTAVLPKMLQSNTMIDKIESGLAKDV